MALYYELPVYRDTYTLLLMVFEATKSFPREYKFTLGQDMKRDCMELVRYIYKANRAAVKTEHLEAYLEQFEILKLELRLCYDLKVIGLRKHAEFSEIMEKIGKQVTGWKKS
ncbi:MAG: four helix bundle protein [Bacteroidales bacterium]|jgi:hypothetical protein|nr:four helix bundle protein [Bacteroidales bacterium]